MAQTHTDPLGDDLTVLWLVLVCPRREVTQMCRCLEFKVKHSKKLVFTLADFRSFLCCYANELINWGGGGAAGSSMAPTMSFVPGQAGPSLLTALQEGDLSFPMWPMGS